MLKIYFFFSFMFLISTVIYADNITMNTDNTSATIDESIHNVIKSNLDTAFKLYYSNEFLKAIGEFETAFDKATDNKFKLNMASYIALSYRGLKEYDKSTRWFHIAYRFATKLDDKDSVSTLLAQIAENYKLLNKYDDAIKFYKQALDGSDIIDNKTSATLLYGLANSYMLNNDYDNAISKCDEATALAIDEKLDLIVLNCNLFKANNFKNKKDYSASLQLYRITYDRAIARVFPDVTINALIGLADIYEKLSRFNASRNKYEEALTVAINNSQYHDVFLIADRIAELLFFTDVTATNADQLSKLLEELDNVSLQQIKNRIATLVADYYTYSNKSNKSLTMLTHNYEVALKSNDNHIAINILYSMARANYHIKNYANALLKIDEALIRAKKESAKQIDKLYAFKAQILYDMKRINEAEKFVRDAIKITQDDLALDRYKDLLQSIDMRKSLDKRLLLTAPVIIDIDNITLDEKAPDEESSFTVNEMITSDDPDIAIDEADVIEDDNVTADLDMIDITEGADDNSSSEDKTIIIDQVIVDNKSKINTPAIDKKR